MFSLGDKVVHSPEGVCVVEEICQMEVAGQKKDFYKLRSIVDGDKVLYVPVDGKKQKFRPLMSKQEVENLLTMELDEERFMSQNMQRRISIQNQAINQDDSALLMMLIKLYTRRKQQARISVGDNNWLKTAEKYLLSEIQEVLNCQREDLALR